METDISIPPGGEVSQETSQAMDTDISIPPGGELSQNNSSSMAQNDTSVHPNYQLLENMDVDMAQEDTSIRAIKELERKMHAACEAVLAVQSQLRLEENGDPSVHNINRELAQAYKDRAEEYLCLREKWLRAEERPEYYGCPTHDRIRQIHRFACYYLQDMESYFPLPVLIFSSIAVRWRTHQARKYMGARIAWVGKQRQLGKDPYAQQDRYTFPLTSTTAIRDALSEERRWILDPFHLPPLELGGLMCLTFRVHWVLKRMPSTFEWFPLKEDLDVRDLTTPWTKEAIRSGHNECEICCFAFSTEFSDEHCVEPAIKAACGHVLGEECTRKWVKAGNRDCPKCRRPLFDLESALPICALPHYEKFKIFRTRIAELDPRIDAFFQQEPQVCNGVEMKHLIEAQSSIWRDLVIAYQSQSSMAWKFKYPNDLYPNDLHFQSLEENLDSLDSDTFPSPFLAGW